MKGGILQIQIPEDICGNPTIRFSENFQHVARLISWFCNLTSRNFKYDVLKGNQVDKKNRKKVSVERVITLFFGFHQLTKLSLTSVRIRSGHTYIHHHHQIEVCIYLVMYQFMCYITLATTPSHLFVCLLCKSSSSSSHYKEKNMSHYGWHWKTKRDITHVANWTPVRRRCGHGRSNSSHSQDSQAEFAALISHFEWM